jgi:hypothetical protein
MLCKFWLSFTRKKLPARHFRSTMACIRYDSVQLRGLDLVKKFVGIEYLVALSL